MTSAGLPARAMPASAQVRGPAAVSGDLRRFANLTLTLAVMEFKLRFFGSVLGYFWQLARPLLLFGVLYVIFSHVVRFNAGVQYFPAVLLTGIVMFTFFADATSSAVTSVADRENLVRKIEFPRLVVPLAAVLTAAFNLALNFVAVMVFVLATGVTPHPTWLLIPVVLAALVVFATGAAMLLSALYPRFRDVKPIWEVVLQIVFYASPILYAVEIVPDDRLRELLMLNPLGALLQQTRHWLIDPDAPGAAAVAGGAVQLLAPAAILAGTFVLGYWVFAREAPVIAEEL
jgi:ABC-2 type transport system permease protein